MAKKRIFIDRNGNAITLLDDRIEQIKDFGKTSINRASKIEFDNYLSVWVIRMPIENSPTNSWEVIDTAPTRKEAVEKEIRILENRYKEKLKNGKLLISSDS